MPEDEIPEDEIAASSPAAPILPVGAELLRTATDPALTEDFALALLKRSDLPGGVIEQLAKNVNVLKSRKVKIALASHRNTPRHVCIPLVRQFYTFDLMKVALSPSVAADVKVAVDDILISRLKTVTIGERLTLARRASGRVAAALLLDVEGMDGKTTDVGTIDSRTVKAKAIHAATTRAKAIKTKAIRAGTRPQAARVMETALDNPRLTEALVINSVLRPAASPALIQAVVRHTKWSPRREIRAALLRTEHLSLARALEFGREIPAPLLRELLNSSRLPGENQRPTHPRENSVENGCLCHRRTDYGRDSFMERRRQKMR